MSWCCCTNCQFRWFFWCQLPWFGRREMSWFWAVPHRVSGLTAHAEALWRRSCQNEASSEDILKSRRTWSQNGNQEVLGIGAVLDCFLEGLQGLGISWHCDCHELIELGKLSFQATWDSETRDVWSWLDSRWHNAMHSHRGRPPHFLWPMHSHMLCLLCLQNLDHWQLKKWRKSDLAPSGTSNFLVLNWKTYFAEKRAGDPPSVAVHISCSASGQKCCEVHSDQLSNTLPEICSKVPSTFFLITPNVWKDRGENAQEILWLERVLVVLIPIMPSMPRVWAPYSLFWHKV